MKKSLLLIATAALLFGACKKDDDNGGTSSGRKGTLTTGKWRILSSSAVIEYPAPLGTQTIDAMSSLPACERDNLYIFNADGTGTTDAGATKCNTSDPQTESAGTWALINGDTQLTVNDGGMTITSDIQTLDNSSMVLKYVTNFNSIRTTTTTTYGR